MADDGEFPNNRDYPALLYKDAFDGTEAEGRDLIAGDGGWTEPWVEGWVSNRLTLAADTSLCIVVVDNVVVVVDNGYEQYS